MHIGKTRACEPCVTLIISPVRLSSTVRSQNFALYFQTIAVFFYGFWFGQNIIQSVRKIINKEKQITKNPLSAARFCVGVCGTDEVSMYNDSLWQNCTKRETKRIIIINDKPWSLKRGWKDVGLARDPVASAESTETTVGAVHLNAYKTHRGGLGHVGRRGNTPDCGEWQR